jgi:ribonucleoside-triphosphate reductase
MHITQEILSSITIFNKYAKYNRDKERRETWDEICDRYEEMMIKKYPTLEAEIEDKMEFIREKKVLMSMRAAQFSGPAITKNNSRVYNCAFLPIDDYRAFSEIMFLLLGGTGVGYSVQFSHIERLPEISIPTKKQKFLIGDSIEGWADAVRALMASYFGKRSTLPVFDFSDIRPKGARLVTAGGKAPGPEPLKRCLFEVQTILERKATGSKLSSLEVHDIVCHIADAVLAGGIRRAALIALFSADDDDMITCKSGKWWELNPQRGRANNSAVFLRHRSTQKFFAEFWNKVKASGAGEPGIYFSNDPTWGSNPCCEIALRPFQFCNLTEVNAGAVFTQKDLNEASIVASFFGTLQAGFTDLHYLRPIWRTTTEKEALIGVGMTGICNGPVLNLDLEYAAKAVVKENQRVASLIGINPAARCTTVKPSGTTSCVVGTSSGIHAWHSNYYIRNMQCSVGDDLFTYFNKHHPELIKVMDWDPKSAVIGIPQKAPDSAILREKETAIDLLNRVKLFYEKWVLPGHVSGHNTNNVSATISIKEQEWEEVGKWMWENRQCYNGLACLPFDGGTYADAPFQEITKEQYEEKIKLLKKPIDLTKILEHTDNTDLSAELACAGGQCEIK